MLTHDTWNWYNSNITERHEQRMAQCAEWVEHYNWLTSELVCWDDATRAFFEEEKAEYLCYDV